MNSVSREWRTLASIVFALFVFLLAETTLSAASVTRGPYLQQGTTNSMVLRWRTDVATDSAVGFGVTSGSFTGTVSDAALVTEHVVSIPNLRTDTKYFYRFGQSGAWFPSNTNQYFITLPPVGTVRPIRIWALGDSGTASAQAAAVRDAYTTFNGNRLTDVWLMLGDNAYSAGTDAEYQTAVFDFYPTYLRNNVLWPTIGNHDAASGSAGPYLNIFSLPQNAEAGGVASGTERYYSFDYANIHFICLDSATSSRAIGGAMYNWVEADLQATMQDWIIVFFHHPPYTKGSHNSDVEGDLIEMRQNFNPLLEQYGVDLVLCGHSHGYERSFLLDGHYGSSATFTAAMKLDGGDGRSDGSGVYQKPAGHPSHEGVVYTVAGSSGQFSASGNGYNHPAMFISMGVLGSTVIDVSSNRLDLTFLKTDATAGDYFTILKAPLATNPPAAPSGLVATAVKTNQINLSWTDNATNEQGFKLERSTNGVDFTEFATVSVNVTNRADTGLMANQTYHYRVRAYNAAGDSGYSGVAQATTFSAPGPDTTAPAAVTNLIVIIVASNSVTLSWTAPGDDGNTGTATSYDVRYRTNAITSNNWTSSTLATGEPAPASAGTTQTFTINGLVANRAYYFALRSSDEVTNMSELSMVATATTLPAFNGDATPPAAVTNLAVTASTSNSVTLSWKAPGDDGNVGTANSYDVRFHTNAITSNNWASATLTTGEPAPTIAGSTQSFTVTGLTPNRTYFFALRTSDETNNISQLSNVASGSTPPVSPLDTNAPAAVTNLFVSVVNSNMVMLSWKAPGDDGANGTATAYDVRWRTNLITTGNWATATQLAGEPAPALAGTSQSLSVTGLTPGRTYYFALRTSDEATNVSPLSNVPDTTTLSARSAGVGIATLIPSNSVWKYLDNGSNQGAAWTSTNFNDTGWTSGVAKLGYGGQGETTVVSYGPSSGSKYITTYFRRHFNVTDPSVLEALALAVVRDDGVVVYLNGQEVFRDNMPSGAISYTTVAASSITGTSRSVFYPSPPISPTYLLPGDNVLAAEIHLRNASSSTMGFNLELKGTLAPPAVQISKASSQQFVLRWPSYPGKSYRVLFTDALPAAGWTNAGSDIFATGFLSAITNALIPNQQRFYRVQLLD